MLCQLSSLLAHTAKRISLVEWAARQETTSSKGFTLPSSKCLGEINCSKKAEMPCSGVFHLSFLAALEVPQQSLSSLCLGQRWWHSGKSRQTVAFEFQITFSVEVLHRWFRLHFPWQSPIFRNIQLHQKWRNRTWPSRGWFFSMWDN